MRSEEFKVGDIVKWKKRNSWEPDHVRYKVERVESPYIYCTVVGRPENRNPVVRYEPWNYELAEDVETRPPAPTPSDRSPNAQD